MNYSTVYIGTSSSALELLCKQSKFDLKSVICEKKRLTSNYLQIAVENNINVISFEDKEELYFQLDLLINSIKIFVIYQFDYILPLKYTSTCKFFNFHSGSLISNRGANPIVRSILNGDKQTELTLHRINERIDQGLLIGKYIVDIKQDDDTVSLKYKTEKGLTPLLEKLILFFEGKIKPTIITGGFYYKPISEIDFTINIEQDTVNEIRNKILSQKQYKGALIILNDERFYIDSIIEIKGGTNENNTVVIKKESILIYKSGKSYKLTINNI